MKVFLLFVIFFCCLLIGFSIKTYFKKRKNFYDNSVKFCEKVLSDISFKNEKLQLIINNSIAEFNDEFYDALFNFNLYLSNKISKTSFQNWFNKKLYFLSSYEKSNFLNFIFSLGSQTKDEEIEKILNYKELLKSLKDEVNKKNRKYSGLYFKLFVVLGLTICIIFL